VRLNDGKPNRHHDVGCGNSCYDSIDARLEHRDSPGVVRGRLDQLDGLREEHMHSAAGLHD
jgi:hypothetical protein